MRWPDTSRPPAGTAPCTSSASWCLRCGRSSQMAALPPVRFARSSLQQIESKEKKKLQLKIVQSSLHSWVMIAVPPSLPQVPLYSTLRSVDRTLVMASLALSRPFSCSTLYGRLVSCRLLSHNCLPLQLFSQLWFCSFSVNLHFLFEFY